jgi:hypothetical protein
MQDLIRTLVEQIEEHWIKFVTAALFMGIGWFFGKRRARGEWARREFLDRLNVSLTTVSGGTLLIRTIIEKSCREVFLNVVAAEAINVAARRTTLDNPILPLPKDDYWYYLNAILNEVAEKFSAGQIKRDLGLPVETARYAICLTCERAGTVRTQKVRAMMVRKELLQSLPPETPRFESPTHAVRWETLQFLAKAYREQPHQFLEVELCM